MKPKIFILLCVFVLSRNAFALSSLPCSEGKLRASESLSYVPAAVVTLHLASLAASQVLWISSTSRDDRSANSKDRGDDPTIYWLLPSLSFDLAVLMSYPTCHSFVEENGRISFEASERQIKTNTRLASGMSLLGQFVSLTNTVDSEKRRITGTLMGATLLSQVLFEWLWQYRDSPSVVLVQPYIQQNSQGIQIVHRF